MSQADTAEYWQDELVKALNGLRKNALDMERASAYLDALDDVAEQMGVATEKVYKR